MSAFHIFPITNGLTYVLQLPDPHAIEKTGACQTRCFGIDLRDEDGKQTWTNRPQISLLWVIYLPK
jgi:hypothetical protein